MSVFCDNSVLIKLMVCYVFKLIVLTVVSPVMAASEYTAELRIHPSVKFNNITMFYQVLSEF